MTVYFARKEYVYSGGDAIFSIPFSYIKKEHISVLVNDEATENYTYLNNSQIQVNDTLEIDDVVSIIRSTPIDSRMVVFSDTSILDKKAQNLAQEQVFDAIQEVYDNNIKFNIDTLDILEANKEELEQTIANNKQELLNIQSSFESEVTQTIADNKQEVLDIQADFEQEVNTTIDTVKEAAEKVNKLEESVGEAKQAAKTATTKADETQEVLVNAITEMDSKLSAANTAVEKATQQANIAASEANKAKETAKDIENIKDVQNMYTTGAVSTDTQGYNQLVEMKYSTFDLSKFTVVGNPTITDDGIASGFSNSNFLKIQNLNISSNIITFNIKFIVPTLGKECRLFNLQTDTTNATRLIIGESTKFSLYSENGAITSGISIPQEWVGDTIEASINLTTTGNKVVLENITKNARLSSTSNNIINLVFDTLAIGFHTVGHISTSIDLKQFSITVDGKEVFNGNKTGLDVIKPDNFEVVGSPVISEDGIASGLDTTLISALVDTSGSSKNTLEYSFTVTDEMLKGLEAQSAPWIVFANNNNEYFISQYYSQPSSVVNFPRIVHYVRQEDDNTLQSITVALPKPLELGDKVHVYFENIQASHLLVEIIVNENKYTNKSLFAKRISFIKDRIKIGGYNSNFKYYGSIDLNSLKIYTDDQLVYQPCLKIPYNISKTGSKIVDVAYRDRVIDLYEQEGQAGYYTIDEENQNFTLPMGEIYGMIGQRSLISSTLTETNRVDVYSDKTCLICGNVATAGTINLPIELVNNNYFITLSTSTKTATSFTTTATGDYILIGKVI